MEQFISLLSSNMSEILSFLGGTLTGSAVTFRLTRSHKAGNNSAIAEQNKASAKRNMAGRDAIEGSHNNTGTNTTAIGRDQINGTQFNIKTN